MIVRGLRAAGLPPLLLVLLLACLGACPVAADTEAASVLLPGARPAGRGIAGQQEFVAKPDEEHASAEGAEEVTGTHRVACTVSVMLFGMLLAGVGILCLVNHSDKDVVEYSWNFISITMSVFIAVLFNQAFFTFIVDQLIEGQHPRIVGVVDRRLNTVVTCLFAVAFWFAMVYFCHNSRLQTGEAHKRKRLYAVGHLGAHSIAFAGIYAVSEALTGGKNGESGSIGLTLVTIGVVMVVAKILWMITKSVRKEYLVADPLNGGEAFYKHFNEEVKEGHTEAIVLILTFLLNQLMCQVLLARLPPLHGKLLEVQWHAVRMMGLCACMSIVLLMITVFVIRRLNKHMRTGVVMAVQTLGMSMSWCLKLTSAWAMQLIFKQFDSVTPELTEVINAFFVTVLSVFAVLLLDWIADKLMGENEKGKFYKLKAAIMGSKVKTFDEVDANHDGLIDRGEWKHAAEDDAVPPIKKEASDWSLEVEEFVVVLRVMILSLGLLVALSWDKAFDAAMETVVEGLVEFGETSGRFGKHEVICKVIVSLSLVCAVFPAWYWYVVPKAMDSGHDHGDHQDETAESPNTSGYDKLLIQERPVANGIRSPPLLRSWACCGSTEMSVPVSSLPR